MGLKEVFQNAASNIVNAFGNVAEMVVYTTEPTQSYNAVTNEITETVESYNIKCIKGTLTQKMAERLTTEEKSIRAGDTVFYVPIEQVTFEVANTATITRDNGEVWHLIHPKLLAADAMWIFVVRKLFNG